MTDSQKNNIRALLKQSACVERDDVFICREGTKTIDNRFRAGESDPLKKILRRVPRLYEFLLWITTTVFFYGLSAEQAMRRAFPDAKNRIILNLGSGTSDFGNTVINVDVAPFANVHVVADAEDLPFLDASADMIVSESMIEHVRRPERGIDEMRRVIKHGGYVYVEMPFIFPFHASPSDYTRFTIEGLRDRFEGFDVIKAGARAGPATALTVQLAYTLALLLSFGSRHMYGTLTHLFFVALFPLKILDQIFRIFPSKNHEAANHIYFFARKT
ncbi:MAG: hypothetical protein A3J10_03420 [Candidatus Sungbacteria bacterium RIFCSPLOWO2_02_FULL_54_10]|uniref:Methyltransferase type 11 domain-containing protein n=2 Tax=Candidatus Sungiibacteriota TaxID=1817917 RepID=A0A1G2L8U9_9BACT|nr:MAG: hypothetical protein A2679_03485 [Candidatus Sungbacteria bacterium RIFCSPHIGHO2_01_FULL_54_26]OHA04003.1 MAG: hypothetical protein A3C92_03610 [Candidatus Sungbacteria bacterium RIFCSPHIGHO2_02_FULL_53_17]OHA07980.1 MAG: hypothetical protein A3B34_00920 [Candidatus Sungbacteria bacterium RIFCSPLOWO2_01_FULL_54_21]OHA13535.1 MAG: hypothetical protein A3J10_03420 [Candidatus Sungbacteria bacterium RIFCSPLOWO2_02_FULL_54_10]